MSELRRALSLYDISTLSSASMGPAYSLASTMGPMVVAAGLGAPLALIAIAAFMGCIASSYGALSRRFPHAGSSYGWASRAFGPHAGAYTAWILLIATSFATLATAIPAGTYTLDLIAPKLADSSMAVAAVSAGWVLVSGLLLAAGIRPTAGVTAWLLFAELIVLLVSAVVAAVAPGAPAATAALTTAAPHAGSGIFVLSGFVSAMVLAIWMVDGWELSAATSEEGRHAGIAGNGGLLALGAMSVTVLLCMLAYLHMLGVHAFLGREADAMTLVGSRLGGAWRPVIVLTVLVSTSASLWTTILYLTRSLFGMGRDGMIPRVFGTLSSDGAPRFALLAITAAATVMTLVSGASPTVSGALNLVLKGSGVFLGLLFVATAASALKLVTGPGQVLRGRILPVIGMAGILFAIVAQIADPSNGDLRISSLGGLLLGIPFAFWRGGRVARLGRPDETVEVP